MEDLKSVQELSVTVEKNKAGPGYTIWINDPTKCVFRAQEVGELRVNDIPIGNIIQGLR